MSIGQYNVSLDNVINNIDIPVDRNLSEQEINNIINQLNLGFDHVNNIHIHKSVVNPDNNTPLTRDILAAIACKKKTS